ncbi:hypothetical protein ACFLZV_06185 [Candidatus Margulisiibacteriota bacterium]
MESSPTGFSKSTVSKFKSGIPIGKPQKKEFIKELGPRFQEFKEVLQSKPDELRAILQPKIKKFLDKQVRQYFQHTRPDHRFQIVDDTIIGLWHLLNEHEQLPEEMTDPEEKMEPPSMKTPIFSPDSVPISFVPPRTVFLQGIGFRLDDTEFNFVFIHKKPGAPVDKLRGRDIDDYRTIIDNPKKDVLRDGIPIGVKKDIQICLSYKKCFTYRK